MGRRWTPTSGSSAMRWRATRRSSRGRTPSRRRGRSSSPFSARRRPCTRTSPPAWAPRSPRRWRRRPAGGSARALFAGDPRRAERYTAEAAGLYLDYSKHRVTDETVRLLVALAEESDLPARIDAMFRGDKINVTEHRAVLHVALRTPRGRSIVVDGEDVVPQVHAVLDRMADFATRVRDGRWTGHTGKRIRNVVNIGIGGAGPGAPYGRPAHSPLHARRTTFRFVAHLA